MAKIKFLQGVINWLRGVDQDAAESIKDPVRDANFAIEDSQAEIGSFTSKVAELVAQSKMLERQITDAQAEVVKYTRIAELAAKAQNADDVTAAVTEKNNAAAKVATLQGELVQNQKLTEQLKAQIRAASEKISGAKSNVTRLSARLQGAKIRESLAEASGAFGESNNPLAKLDELQQTVDTAEARADAKTELATEVTTSTGAGLAAKYDTKSPDVSDEVARLMAANAPASVTPAPPAG
jgi:phage shock protein A